MYSANDATAAPSDVFGRGEGAHDASGAQVAYRSQAIGDGKRFEDEAAGRLSRIASADMSREGGSSEQVADVAIEGREAVLRNLSGRVRPTRVRRSSKRLAWLDRVAANERLIEGDVSLEAGPVREEELQRDVLARRPARFRQEGSEGRLAIETGAGDRDRSHRLRQARQVEEKADVSADLGPPLDPSRRAANGAGRGYPVTHDALRDVLGRQWRATFRIVGLLRRAMPSNFRAAPAEGSGERRREHMRQAVTLADLRRALAEQDAQLAAAFAALDPKLPIAVSTASLKLLAEACAGARLQPRSGLQNTWGTLRC